MAERDQDLLKFYRSEIQWQSGLVSGRLNAFIASQSFLVIAYATAISSLVGNWKNPFALLFPPFLGVLALVLIFQAWSGIHSAYAELKGWQECQDRLLFDRQELGDYDLYLNERRVENATAYPGAAWKYFRQGVLFPRHARGFSSSYGVISRCCRGASFCSVDSPREGGLSLGSVQRSRLT